MTISAVSDFVEKDLQINFVDFVESNFKLLIKLNLILDFGSKFMRDHAVDDFVVDFAGIVLSEMLFAVSFAYTIWFAAKHVASGKRAGENGIEIFQRAKQVGSFGG